MPLAVVVRDVAGQPVSSLHTFVPVFTRKEFEPVTLTWLPPVTAPADRTLFSDKARGGRPPGSRPSAPAAPLDALVAAAQGHQVTWVLDPAIVRPVPTLLADGTGPAPGATTPPQDGADSTDPSSSWRPVSRPGSPLPPPPSGPFRMPIRTSLPQGPRAAGPACRHT